MITRPALEWDVIAPEPASVGGLFTGYACILAAIGPIASLLGDVVFLHEAVLNALASAVLDYGLSLVGVYVLALILDGLAPNFGAEKDQLQALKLAVYSSTGAWIAGIGGLLPPLAGILALVGLVYTFYTLYLGMPKLMKAPADKLVGYFVIVVVADIVISLVIGAVAAAIARV
jgi:hypothetical protein